MSRSSVFAIYEPANGRTHLVAGDRIVTEREALELLGARNRPGYVHIDDELARRSLAGALRIQIPALVNHDRTAFRILAADEAPIRTLEPQEAAR